MLIAYWFIQIHDQNKNIYIYLKKHTTYTLHIYLHIQIKLVNRYLYMTMMYSILKLVLLLQIRTEQIKCIDRIRATIKNTKHK